MKTADLIRDLSRFCDRVLETTTDRWSGRDSPLLADGFDVETGEPAPWRWGGKDRIPSNLPNQQNLMRTLRGLSTLTGEPRFHDRAIQTTRYALQHTAEPHTGLLYWGGHMAWDLRHWEPAYHEDQKPPHELKRHYPDYELMYEADPEATGRYVRAFWDSHMYNWDRCDFGRHGAYGQPAPDHDVWDEPYVGGDIFFISQGLGFCNTGSDMIYAAAMLGHLSGDERPLTWAQRMADRYEATRHPDTGLVGYQFSQSDNDRAQRQFGPEFGPYALEGTILSAGRVTIRYGHMGLRYFALANMLGEAGRCYGEWAHSSLAALAKHAYDPEQHLFLPMFSDGRRVTPEDRVRDGYYSLASLTPWTPEPVFFRAYLRAWRFSQDPLMWDMARRIGKDHGLGDIGASPAGSDDATVAVHVPDKPVVSDGSQYDYPTNDLVELLEGLVELSAATGRSAYLGVASAMGQSIMDQHYRDGLFLPSDDVRFTRIAPREPLALLHLAGALEGKSDDLPEDPFSACYFTFRYEGHPMSEANKWNRIEDNNAVYAVKKGQPVIREPEKV